jgi:Flp pilus assembly protein TadG
MRRVRGGGAERGAVAALVAIVFGSGVMVGLGAIVIDAGQAYSERAQLQNGADSAALAVAARCSLGAATCDIATTASSIAGTYAGKNAKDGTSTVTLVCGHDSFGKLVACPASDPARPANCGDAPVAGSQYVEVHTATRTTDGKSVLPPVFGRALLGNSFTGVGVTACARVAFGTPAGSSGLALTASYCEWKAAITATGGTEANPKYASPPPAVPAPTSEIVIYFHDTAPTPSHCVAGPSGFDVPGDFGSTQTSDANCNTQFNFDPASGSTTYASLPGSSLSAPCQAALLAAQLSHRIVFLPIYDRVTGSGGTGAYTLWRMAAFVITGYYWPSWSSNSWLTQTQPCKGNARCISGYFTTGVSPGQNIISGSGAGASVLRITN